jgi:hypothetical protein
VIIFKDGEGKMTKQELKDNKLDLRCIICNAKMKPEKTYSLQRNLNRKYCSPKCSFVGQVRNRHPWRPSRDWNNGR